MRREGEIKMKRRGQSTLEYILILAAILVAVIIGANTWVKPGTENVLKRAGKAITGATAKVKTGLGL